MDEYVQHATAQQLPTLIAISLLLGLGKGGVPGLATVATAATVLTAPPNVIGGLGYAVALMVPILTIIDIYAAYLHRVALDWSTVWILLPPSFCGMGLGVILNGRLSDSGARLLVGTILLGILALRTWKDIATLLFPSYAIQHHLSGDSKEHKIERKGSEDSNNNDDAYQHKLHEVDIEGGHDDIKKRQINTSSSSNNHAKSTDGTNTLKSKHHSTTSRLVWAITVGTIGGCATMLTNSMGPILNVYLLSVAELSPQSYVGTRAMFFCFLNLGKIPMRIVGGTLGMVMLPLVGICGLVSVVGVFLAKSIMLGMNEKTFVKLELGVVAFAGLRLCWMGVRG